MNSFRCQSRFLLSNVMTIGRALKNEDSRLNPTAGSVSSPGIQRGARVLSPHRRGLRTRDGGDHDALRIDLVGPAREQREPNVTGGGENLDGTRQHDGPIGDGGSLAHSGHPPRDFLPPPPFVPPPNHTPPHL